MFFNTDKPKTNISVLTISAKHKEYLLHRAPGKSLNQSLEEAIRIAYKIEQKDPNSRLSKAITREENMKRPAAITKTHYVELF